MKKDNVLNKKIIHTFAKKKRNAFSLVEMLMALLIASILLAAMAPVMTKHTKESIEQSVQNQKGVKIWNNPGAYSFNVPKDITKIKITASGGEGEHTKKKE